MLKVGDGMIDVGGVYAKIVLNIEKWSKNLKNAENQMNKFATNIKSQGDRLESVGKSMMLKISTPLATIGTMAVKTTAAFDDQMSTVKALTRATGEEFEGLREQARELGRETRYSASEAAEGMENLARAGFEVNEIQSAMPGMLGLATAGALDLGEAASITANVLNAFGLEAEKATHVADVLGKAAADADTDVQGLGEAMSYLAPIAYDMGWSLEESTAAIMALSDQGIKGAKAGAAFSTSLGRLAKPTDEAANVMKELNLEFFDAEGKMKALPEIVAELETGLEGMSDQQRTAALTTLFGAEAYKHWSILVNEGSESLEGLTEQLVESDGFVEEFSETVEDNFAGSMRELKSKIEDVMITIGELLIPTVQSITDKIEDLTERFAALPKETQENIVKFGLMAVAAGPLIFVLGKLFTVTGTVIGGFGKLLGMFKLLSVAKIKDKIETIALIGLYTKDAVVKAASTVATKTMTAATVVWNGVAKVAAVVTKGLGMAFQFLTSPIGIVITVIGVLVAIVTKLWRTNENFRNAVIDIWGDISGFILGVGKELKEFAKSIPSFFKELPGKMLNIGKNLMTSLAKGIKDKMLAPVRAAKKAANAVKNKFEEVFRIGSPSKVMEGYGKNIDEGLAIGIRDNIDIVEKAAEYAARRVNEVFDNIEVEKLTPKINIDEKLTRKRSAEIVIKGEDAEFRYRELLDKMNNDELEKTKELLDNEYKYQKSIIDKKLKAELEANAKASNENAKKLREERDRLKSNHDYALGLIDERSQKISDTADKNAKDFNRNMDKIDKAIEVLSEDTEDLTEKLTNQNAIVILQERKVDELEKRYNDLADTLGVTAENTKQVKEELENARKELIETRKEVVRTEKEIRQAQIDAINDLTERVKRALKERYEDERRIRENAIKEEIDSLDRWRDESLDRINKVYDEKIRRIEEAAEIQIQALEDELKALEEAEEQKSREEIDAEEKRKIAALEEAIAYEHNEFNKVELQKELNRVLAEREKRLRKQQIDDRKKAIKDEIQDIKDSADRQKRILEEQKEYEIDRINSLYEYEKEVLEIRMEDIKEFYDWKTEEAQLQAEAEKMIIDNQQKEIIELLHSYEEAYKQAGQSLGEKLVEGFEPAIDRIMGMIDEVSRSIGAVRDREIQGLVDSTGYFVITADGVERRSGPSPVMSGSGLKEINNEFNFYSPRALSPSEQRREMEKGIRKASFIIA